MVWALATVRSARCPGKHVLHLRLVEVETGQRARWYYTATREIVLKLPILAALLIAAKAVTGSGNTAAVAVAFVVLGLAAVSSAGSISNGRSMFDLLVGTVVVDERGEPPVPEQLALPFSDLAVAGTEPL
jgi:hypothetical protein